MTDLQAAAAAMIITPPVGGEMLEPRGVATTGIHDELYARVLLLHDGSTTIAIVTLDLLGLDAALVDQIQQAVFKRTGLSPEELMLNASHTHSAPITIDCCQARRDPEWEAELVRKVTDTIDDALHQLTPATLSVGQAPVNIGINRRVATMGRTRLEDNPAGPVYHQVDCLFVHTLAAGDLIAVLFSTPAHPVTVHDTATLFSADFPGATVTAIQSRLGQHVIPLYAQGCAGNVNVRQWRGGFAAAQAIGTQLAEAVVLAYTDAVTIDAGVVRVATEHITLPFQTVNPAMAQALVDRVYESYAVLQDHETDARTLDDAATLCNWADRMAQYAESTPSGLPMTVQGFALGDSLVMMGLNHEPFVEYQLDLKAESPFPHTLVFAYTNEMRGYIPTGEAFLLGGYEVVGAPKLYGLPYLTPECETIVKHHCKQLLDHLYPGIQN